MPNYYAHLKFGGKVLADLPGGLAKTIRKELPAFQLGCLGPDPLFFYQPIRPNAVRREAVWMHRGSALPAARRLRQAIEEELPMAVGYSAGFLCHLALDSACHGYVDERAAEGPICHMAIEGEYDRMLMLCDGLDVTDRAWLPVLPEDWRLWTAASRAYAHASPRQLRRAYRSMSWLTSFLARSCGTGRGKVIGAVSRMLPIPSSKGIALAPEPHPSAAESNADLDRLLEAAVPEAAEQITAFFDTVHTPEPVPDWFDRDFKGSPPHVVGVSSWRRAHRHYTT